MSGTVITSKNNALEKREFAFNDWKIITQKSHILESKCPQPDDCSQKAQAGEKCLFCQYEASLQITHFPDMTFAKNLLRLEHKNGFGLEFRALEALREVKERALLRVHIAAEWQEARKDCEFARQLKENFDWTFSTQYAGHTFSSHKSTADDDDDDGTATSANDKQEIEVIETQKRIPFDKLKVQEEILFIDEVDIFEDELADNGVSRLSVKIRAMPSKIYILMRYFLRVDRIKIKIYDTRIYFEEGQSSFIREITRQETDDALMKRIEKLGLSDPNDIASILPKNEVLYHELILPNT